MVCTFFGHRDALGLDERVLENALREQIEGGADQFYVGHQGEFDRMVFVCLQKLRERYPHISVTVVLAYLTGKKSGAAVYGGCSIYPEGLESVPPRFAIDKRNEWMIRQADICLCYVTSPGGGAHKFMKRAERAGLTVINLGSKVSL